uniref:Uncharacterized protein n=1 Tax=Nelumbo nucifera TaxID=4432 RepID=A0A822Y2K9_NELNU|nr:TPA_asm: hypothetical protein HUJ06_026759 [Nelumbo nucifera]
MACNRITSILLLTIIAFFVFVSSFSSRGGVEAARVSAAGDFARETHLIKTSHDSSSVYDETTSTMLCWLGRLSSGQSPKGPGH